MNLHHKKVRIPIAALGVTALIAGAGALVSPAFAAGETLSFLGLTTNTATVVNTDPATLGNAAMAYGLRPSGSGLAGAGDLRISLATGAPGTLSFARAAVPGGSVPSLATLTADPGASATAISIPGTVNVRVGDSISLPDGTSATEVTAVAVNGANQDVTIDTNAINYPVGVAVNGGALAFLPLTAPASATVPSYVPGDNVYLGATAAGSYKIRLFKDAVADNNYDSATEDATPEFTLVVKAPADAFTYSAPANAEAGANPPVTIGTSLSTKDVYGTTGSTPVGILGTQIARSLGVLMAPGANTTNVAATGAPTFNGTAFTKDLAGSSAGFTLTDPLLAGSLTSRLQFAGGNVTGFSPITTSVASNGVVTLANAVGDGQTKDVSNAAGTVKIRPGVGTVTYVAKATNTGGTGLAGKTVNLTFGVAGTVALTDLTVNGVVLTSTGKATAVTDADGYAPIKVLSAKTAAVDGYTIATKSGAITGTPAITAAYEAAVATDVMITSTSAELTPTVGTASVTVKGELRDQFGEKYQPPSSISQQVAVTGSASGNAVVTDGAFSYVFTPATAPAAGTTTPLTFTYNGHSATATIQWASTTAPGSVKLTTPLDGAKAVTLQDNTTPVPTQINGGTPAFGNTTGAVTGTVFDASNAALAFKAVTLSGSTGVYFSTSATPDATHPLVKMLDVVTSSTGVITGAWVYFTKSGDAKVTATAGSVKAESSVTTDQPAANQGFHIAVNDVAANPGQTVIVTGKVDDVFGNPVPSANVDLSAGASTVGALGDNTIQTNSAGIFSTTFLAGSNQSGVVDLTATIAVLSADPTAVAAYALAGVTLEKGNYQDTGKITVTELKVLLTATAKLNGTGTAKVGGSFIPKTGVDIYSKASGAVSYTLLDSVQTDAEGDFGASYTLKKTTSFLAKSAGLSSKTVTTKVYSKVTVTAKSMSKGHATIWANGSPNAKGSLKFYRSIKGKDPLLKSMTSNSSGNGSATVKLPKGTRYVYVVYDAPGTYAGASGTIKVKVK